MTEKYYLKAEWQKEYQEVTKEEWIKAERSAGFYWSWVWYFPLVISFLNADSWD